MKNNIKLIIALLVLVIIIIFLNQNKKLSKTEPVVFNESTNSTTKVDNEAPVTKTPTSENSIKFTGKLEKVDTGCFADGECFVIVDGKHVTVIMGWSGETVGQVIGGDNSIGGLENFIGKDVEVYAKVKDSNNYTLYGDINYYIKVK